MWLNNHFLWLASHVLWLASQKVLLARIAFVALFVLISSNNSSNDDNIHYHIDILPYLYITEPQQQQQQACCSRGAVPVICAIRMERDSVEWVKNDSSSNNKNNNKKRPSSLQQPQHPLMLMKFHYRSNANRSAQICLSCCSFFYRCIRQ